MMMAIMAMMMVMTMIKKTGIIVIDNRIIDCN